MEMCLTEPDTPYARMIIATEKKKATQEHHLMSNNTDLVALTLKLFHPVIKISNTDIPVNGSIKSQQESSFFANKSVDS